MVEKVLDKRKMKEQVQGVLTWGHGYLNLASYILIHIPEGSNPKGFLNDIKSEITPSSERPKDAAVNVAMTHTGLRKFGLPDSTLGDFNREFKEGMNTPHRSFLLGDFGVNDPKDWQWGALHQQTPDILFMVFDNDQKKLDDRCKAYMDKATAHGLTELFSLPSETLPDDKEHFGFKDGIGQPKVEGISKEFPDITPADKIYDPSKPAPQSLNTGEALLGYINQYSQFARNALVTENKGKPEVLPQDNAGSGNPSFGQNGSYLVFRHLKQDVYKFWDFLREEASKKGDFETNTMVKYGAKMVGRWPNGVPLTIAPDSEPTDFGKGMTKREAVKKMDHFLYAPTDKDGYKCPRGSHLRRSNPRDALSPNPQGSLKITDKHRILRRGRPYGPPLVPDMDPSEMLKKGDDGVDRGLVFIAFVGDISRQYEFTQHDWNNAPKFDDLYSENDPVVGNHYKQKDCPLETDNFTIQACPVRHRMNDLPNFIKTEGGGYFFLPSISAIEYLTTL